MAAGQTSRVEKQVLYITKNNGDTIEIIGQSIDFFSDTVIISVNYLKNSKRKKLQHFKTLYSFPLDISLAVYDNKKGILIKYDPGVRYGNSFLYLFDEKKSILREIKGFKDLGRIYNENYKNRKYFYSYVSCGCANECWVSKLFTIKEYKLNILAILSCDCSKLISTYKPDPKMNSCDAYNNDHKFNSIAEYWRTKVKNGG